MRRLFIIEGIAVVTLLLISFIPKCGADEVEGEDWMNLIKSNDSRERLAGKSAALRERKEMIEYLLSIVDRPVEKGEQFLYSDTPRNIAISLLGTLRSEEAVSSLMNWLLPHEGQGIGIWGSGGDVPPPAGLALAQIGLPAVEPLLDKMKYEGRTNMGVRCLITFVYILGPDLAEFKLGKAIASERDEKHKQNLGANLKLLMDHKLPEPLYIKH